MAIGTCRSSRTSSRLNRACSRIGDQIVLALALGQLVGVRQQFVERVVLLQVLAGDLRPDQRHARHVVDRVADQRLKIDDLVGPDAPVGLQRRRVVDLVFADVVDLDPTR